MADRTRRTDRGQMEVLGFVVVFGIIVTSIAILGVTGLGGLNDVRDTEKAANAVRVMEILDTNVDDLIRGRAPYRATEIKMRDSQLTLGDPMYVSVRGTNTTGVETFNYTEEILPIEYLVTDETTLLYAAGAVIRDDTGDAVMLREPTLLVSPDAMNVPIVQTRATWQRSSVGGSRSVNLRTQFAGMDALVSETEPHSVDISVTSAHPDVWERYFESLEHSSVVRTDETVTVSIDADRVYINTVQVNVVFE